MRIVFSAPFSPDKQPGEVAFGPFDRISVSQIQIDGWTRRDVMEIATVDANRDFPLYGLSVNGVKCYYLAFEVKA